MAFSHIPITLIFAIVFLYGLQQAIAQDDVPTFRLTECEADGHLCIKVTFVDGEEDLIVADEYHGERNPSHDVFKGTLKNDVSKAKVVILLSQEPGVKDLIAFKSSKMPGCRKYRVSLKESGEASCSKGLDWEKLGIQKTIGQDNLKLPPKGEETRNVSQTIGNNEDRQMSPTGYKVTAVVYYDDVFKKEFGEKADTRINAVMALVDEQFDEMKIEIDIEVIAVEYMKGQSWTKNWMNKILCTTEGCVGYDIPMASDHNANIYVFITGHGNKDFLGLAWEGYVCDERRFMRTSITQYHNTWKWPRDTLAEDEATAETVTHEIGHNLGLKHDFQEDSEGNPIKVNGEKIPRQVNGVDCTGYMDYKSHTDGWSTCSYLDFVAYFKDNSPDFCLTPINKNYEEYYEEEREPRKRFMHIF